MLDSTDLNSRLLAPEFGFMNFLNEVRERYPEAISFAAGRPHEDFFNVAQSFSQINTYARAETSASGVSHDEKSLNALGQYGRTNGLIQSEFATMLAIDEGIHVAPESIVITVGCQEAMLLCLLCLCNPERDVLLVADPAYIGMTGIAGLLGIDICPVQSGSDGLDLDDLEAKIQSVTRKGMRTPLLYDIPDFSNPLGASMPLEARQRLLGICQKNDLIVLEDQAYRNFSYDGDPPPSLKALDESGQVIAVGSFSKSIFPGLRVGYIIADQVVTRKGETPLPLTEYLSKVKGYVSVNTPTLSQAIVGETLRSHGGSLQRACTEKVNFYRENRDFLLTCLKRTLGNAKSWASAISWNRPKGGFFVSLSLPVAIMSDHLWRSAEQYGVIWVPMRYFYVDSGGENQIRLSFSYVSKDAIEEGVARLARFLKDLLESSPRK